MIIEWNKRDWWRCIKLTVGTQSETETQSALITIQSRIVKWKSI